MAPFLAPGTVAGSPSPPPPPPPPPHPSKKTKERERERERGVSSLGLRFFLGFRGQHWGPHEPGTMVHVAFIGIHSSTGGKKATQFRIEDFGQEGTPDFPNLAAKLSSGAPSRVRRRRTSLGVDLRAWSTGGAK